MRPAGYAPYLDYRPLTEEERQQIAPIIEKTWLQQDLESRVSGGGRLRFLEVKGRVAGTRTVTVTKNEILTGLNKPDDFILAIVVVDGETATPRYVRRPFQREPDFGVTSVNYDLEELLARSEEPA